MHEPSPAYSVWVFLALAVVLTSATLFVALKVMSLWEKRGDKNKRAKQSLANEKNEVL
jgi:hypothetical protein